MTRHVLLLGCTGVDKSHVVDQLRRTRQENAVADDFADFDFERDFVTPRFHRGMPDYLDSEEPYQLAGWRSAWQEFLRQSQSSSDVLLALHGVLARKIFGIRSPICLDDLRDWGVTHIVTLIEDVYFQWYRTESRARGQGFRGQPTLAQLLEARRAELLIADAIRNHLDPDARLPNWLVAVRHPARLLNRVLFSDAQRLRPVYLSFPISGPRRRAAEGDPSAIEAVNRFLQEATDFERQHQQVAAFCPLSIDELPLLMTATDLPDSETSRFEVQHRWNVHDFYGSDETLLAETPTEVVDIPRSQVEEARGLIAGDVGRRDYRLVNQSQALAVFSPMFGDTIASGVENEILYALRLHIPVHIFQDASLGSPSDARDHLLGRSVGALGMRPDRDGVVFHDSIAEVLREAST